MRVPCRATRDWRRPGARAFAPAAAAPPCGLLLRRRPNRSPRSAWNSDRTQRSAAPAAATSSSSARCQAQAESRARCEATSCRGAERQRPDAFHKSKRAAEGGKVTAVIRGLVTDELGKQGNKAVRRREGACCGRCYN